jgi:hypothetical protein
MQGRIEYAIVALRLSGPEIERVVKEATGLTVEAGNTAKLLQTLDMSQLAAIWKRLSEDPRWGAHGRAATW